MPRSSVNFIKVKAKPSKGKKVQFARLLTEYRVATDFGDSLETRWYQHDDYEKFRNQAASDAARIVSGMYALTRCISCAYKAAGRIALNAKNETTMMVAHETLGPNFQLLLWCNASCTRGNEKSVLNSLVVENATRIRANHRRFILSSQRKCDEHTLGLQSERITRKSRVFARMMGTADACIAFRLEHSSKPKKTLPVEVKAVDHPCQQMIQQRQFCAVQA
jgi:hypothetical protein